MNTLHARFNRAESKGAALIIVLAFIVLLTAVVVAYFSRATTDRQLAKSSFDDTAADLLARSALDIVVSDLKQEIVANQPVSSANIQPTPYPIPTPVGIPNLIRRSSRDAAASRASNISSTSASANSRSISTARWNSHYLIPRGNTGITVDSSPVPSFTAPDWVLITSQGPNTAPPPSAVIGRYAFAVYDEGGLLDMSLAGYPTGTSSGGGPAPTPTPWMTNVGRKGIVTFADLTALPAAPTTTLTQTQINNIVGWRNFATTGQSDGSFGSPSFNWNLNRQDTYGSYLLDFGDPPYPTPCPVYPFTSVATDTSSARTDQAFMTRQELLKLRSSLGFSQNVLQYMGTFSRERNQPARDWPSIGTRLPDRFDIAMLSLVKPNPPGTPPSRGKGKGKQRGRFKGDAGSILSLFGLKWIAGTGTDPHLVTYWGHWLYVGTPGVPPNPNPHIPALRGGRNDFFQILDYALTQANANNEDTVNAQDIMSLGASLIDQNDGNNSGATPDDLDPRTGTPITIIQTGTDNGQFVLGWENGQAPAATDTNTLAPLNPYNWITDPATLTTKPRPPVGFTPIVLNHPFSTVGDFGYGLRPEYATNRFQRVDFHTVNPCAPLLDFFTYNPVDHNYPRVGSVNLNTKNTAVIGALLQSALKKDLDVPSSSFPIPFPTVAPSEATTAAQAIFNATNPDVGGTRATRRADIARLTAAAASAISTAGFAAGEEQEKVPEAIARALCEVTQTRTWNLMIDVIAQTGRYAPGTPDLTDPTKFIVEGEKRYWLHISLGRDLNAGAVDVLGQQLEEMTE
jgi:Tfp pilus assembly protein PilX